MISGSANRLKRNGSTSSTVSGPPKFKSKTPTRSSSAFRICEFQSPLLAEETRRRRRPRDGETPSLVDVGAPLLAVLKDDFFDAHDFEDDDDDDEAHRASAVVEKSDLIVVATTSTTTTTTTTTKATATGITTVAKEREINAQWRHCHPPVSRRQRGGCRLR